MTQEIKFKLEQAAEQITLSAYGHKDDTAEFYQQGIERGMKTILENPSEWGLQEIPDYYCTEKDRIGYVCEDGPCDRCELLIQQDAVATRNELLVESEKEIISLQSQLTKYRAALERLERFTSDNPDYEFINHKLKEALEQEGEK